MQREKTTSIARVQIDTISAVVQDNYSKQFQERNDMYNHEVSRPNNINTNRNNNKQHFYSLKFPLNGKLLLLALYNQYMAKHLLSEQREIGEQNQGWSVMTCQGEISVILLHHRNNNIFKKKKKPFPKTTSSLSLWSESNRSHYTSGQFDPLRQIQSNTENTQVKNSKSQTDSSYNLLFPE